MNKNSLLGEETANIPVELDLEGEFLKVDKKINEYNFGEYIVILSMGLLLAVVSVTVLGRLLFRGSGLAWSEELGRILLICVAYAGLGLAYKEGMHFKVDEIPGVPKQLYRVFDIFSCIAEIGVMLLLFVKSSELVWMTRSNFTPAMAWPSAVFYAPLCLGTIVMTWYSAKRLFFILKGGQSNE